MRPFPRRRPIEQDIRNTLANAGRKSIGEAPHVLNIPVEGAYNSSMALSNPAMPIVLGVPGTSGEYDSAPNMIGLIFVPFRT